MKIKTFSLLLTLPSSALPLPVTGLVGLGSKPLLNPPRVSDPGYNIRLPHKLLDSNTAAR
jgi:hypothetical protein